MIQTLNEIAVRSCRLSALALTLSFAGLAQAAPPMPPVGQTLLAIGQDTDSINAYVKKMGSSETPGGVTVYMNIFNDGLLSEAPYTDAGRNNVTGIAKKYPNSVLVVGLWMVGYLDQINAGDFDDEIDVMIKTFKGLKRPIYLRFGYEFDGTWNAYDPAAFKKAWKRFHKRVGELKARDNIIMVWQSSSFCWEGNTATHEGKDISAWWPGDNYVDMVGLSYFTPGAIADGRGGTCSVANQAIERVAGFANDHGKPLMVAESSPQGYDLKNLTWRAIDGSATVAPPVKVPVEKIQGWYYDYFKWIKDRNVKIVAYINANWNAQPAWDADADGSYPSGYWGDSRVQVNDTIKTTWTQHVSGYLKASNSLFSILGYQGESAAAEASLNAED